MGIRVRPLQGGPKPAGAASEPTRSTAFSSNNLGTFPIERTRENEFHRLPGRDLSSIGVENPIGYDAQDFAHAYESINRFKVVELMRVRPDQQWPSSPDNAIWGHWRTMNFNLGNVHENVLLFPEEKVFNFAYTNNYGKAWESLSGGAVGKVMQLGEMLRVASAMAGNNVEMGGKFVSRFKEAPTWLSTLPLEFANTLKFNFQFGQAGLFSARDEVVIPILQLAALFLPISGGISGTYFRGPVPTPPQYIANFMTRFFSGSTLTDIKTGFSDLEQIRNQDNQDNQDRDPASGTVGKLASGVTALENALLNAKDQAIQNTLANHHGGALGIRMGRMTFGPFLIKNVSWSFDFTQVDEFGFPYKGSLSYSGLESIIMPSISNLTSVVRKSNAVIPEITDSGESGGDGS